MKALRPPLKVLQVCAVDFTVRQFVAPVCLALQRAGFTVKAACTPGPYWSELSDMGITMIRLPIARSANPLLAIGSIVRLYRLLRRERFDVLHVHTPVAAMIARIAGFLARVPVVVYTAHGFYFHDRMPRSKWLLHVGLERFFGLMTSLVICVSREDYALARRLRFVPFGKVVHVPNGVALDRFDPERLTALKSEIREKNGLPVDATVITIMGRLVREKGYFEFFHAARQLAPQYPGVHFMVIGDTVTGEHDGAKVAILELAGAEELKGRVHFMGLRSDIPELLAACDVFVLPSYREGMPVSILEAMAMGLPVVATRIRGCREEVIPGRTGLLVEPENAEELAEALGFLLRNPEPRRRMGRAGRLIAERHFDERRTLQRQVRLYRLLERRLRP